MIALQCTVTILVAPEYIFSHTKKTYITCTKQYPTVLRNRSKALQETKRQMEGDRSFDELFYTFGIAIPTCAIMVSMVKCFTEYYVYIIVCALGVLTAMLVLYQRYIYNIYRTKQRAVEESELRNYINRIEVEQLTNESRRSWVRDPFHSHPGSSVPMRKFNRTVKQKRTGSHRY